MLILSDLIDSIDVTTVVYQDAETLCNETKRNQTLYAWNITTDSYDYVVVDSEDTCPEVVQFPYATRFFVYSPYLSRK